MSKVMLALGSFIVGAICGSLALSGIHASTVVQLETTGTIAVQGAIPVVPPLTIKMSQNFFRYPGEQSLDGINCDHCTFEVKVFSYAGGAYSLTNSTLKAEVNGIVLRGAALNTFNLLRAFGVIPTPPPPTKKQNPSTAPMEATIDIPSNQPVNLVSLAGLKQ